MSPRLSSLDGQVRLVRKIPSDRNPLRRDVSAATWDERVCEVVRCLVWLGQTKGAMIDGGCPWSMRCGRFGGQW